MKRKYFIACDYSNSHPDSPNLAYEPRHKNKNAIRTRAKNTMVCMPEHENVNMKGQFVLPITIIQRHPIHLKLQYDLIQQLMKRVTSQELHEKVPQKPFPNEPIM